MNFDPGDPHKFLEQAPKHTLLKTIDIQNRIADAGLDQQKVLQTICDGAREMTEADGAAIEFVEKDELVYVAVSGTLTTNALGLRVRAAESLSGRCVRENKTLLCTDSESDDRVDRVACRKIGVRSMVVLPLVTPRSIVGVLKVFSKTVDSFKPEHESALSILTSYFARSLYQAELAKNRADQFEVLANSLPQLVWMAGADGSINWYNDRWYEYTGTEAKDMVGWGWKRVHDPRFLPAVMKSWGASIATGASFEMIFPLRSATGEFRLFLTRVIPVKDRSGKVVSWFGTNTDIDDQKRVEQDLRFSQQRYATLTESIPQLVWTSLPDGSCDYLSQQWTTYTGEPEINQLGFDWLDKVIHPNDRERTYKHWMGAVRGEHGYDIEYRIKRADGEYRWFKTRGAPMRDEEGRITQWVGTCTDIHDQKLVAEELLRAKEEAERANDLKTAFLANMSHEIRTPLGAMMGFADLLTEPGLEPSERANYVDILHRNGEQLGRVINDILDLSKVETGYVNFEYVKVKPLETAKEVVSLMSVVAKEKGIELIVSSEDSTPDEIVTDPTRLKQVLINLVGNALKFTKQGSIHIALSGYQSSKREKSCAFDIIDTGVGIPDEAKERLFKMFSQADNSMTRKYGGTGLGLALSRSLARAMGGDVRLVTSSPEKGSTFHFSVASKESFLPSIDEHAKVLLGTPASTLGPKTLAHVRVLLVEDSPDNQQLIKRYLAKYGAFVEIANNGQEGVTKAMSSEHDLILMDIQMPVMDGYTAVGKLRANGYRKPIIALTAHAMSDVQSKCRDVGCTTHLPKPINPKELVQSILLVTEK